MVPGKEASAVTTGRKRILVVDDDPDIGTTCRIVLPQGDTEMAGGHEEHEEVPCGGKK